LLCVIISVSCGFIDLREIGISIEPGTVDFVLPGPQSPVIIKFDTEMLKNETEGIIQISSDFGAVSGDKFWSGNNLYFVPVSGWTAGVRYTLSLMGTVRSADGRELRLERYVSFFAINKNDPPYLEWYSPLSGESVRTNNLTFEFHFSSSMNRPATETALTFDGIGNKTFEWSDDSKILKVVPEKALSPWTAYRWNLRDSAKSIDGVPLAKTYSGFFITDLDQTLPYVKNVYPVLFSDGCWYPTGRSIETGLDPGQGIAVEFSKPMGDNVLRSLRFEPSLTGRTEYLSEESIVYIFSRDPEPETIYTLIVSGDTRDTEGLKTGTDHIIYFFPDIPFLKTLSLTHDSVVFDTTSITDNVLPVYVDPGTGELNFFLNFSLLFNFDEKLNSPQRISLSPFFPRTLAPIALQYVKWVSDDRLFMRWEGLTAGDEYPHYYKLVIPGGKSGISSSRGFFMKEDITIYLEAVK